MSYRVAAWLGTVWEDISQERFGPTTRSKNRAVDRDASEQALADATIKLWHDLWQRAHAPCPRCGTVRG